MVKQDVDKDILWNPVLADLGHLAGSPATVRELRQMPSALLCALISRGCASHNAQLGRLPVQQLHKS